MAASQTLQTIISINAKTGSGFSQVGATLTELGSMVEGISSKLIGFGKESLDVYQDYEKSMKDAEVALSTSYGRGTAELTGVMSQLDDAATEWAANSIFHTNDVANAISEAAHAGWDCEHIMSGLPAAMELAQAGGLDLSEAVNYIVKSTNAAGIGFEDMSNFIDLWTYAANSSASTVEEFGDAMLRMGSTMRFTGSTEELMTLIAVTANAGSVGAEAGTMIRNSIMRLIAPTDKAKEVMGELGATSEETAEVLDDQALAAANATLAAHGFSVYDENGNLNNVLDIYNSLYGALVDITGGLDDIDAIGRNKEAVDILTTIFPTRTVTEALTLLRGAAEEYGGLYESMMNGDAAGYGQYAAETQMDTLYGRVETFGSKMERLKQRVGEELSEPYEDLLEWLGGIVDTVSNLDEGSFDMLIGAAEAIAAAGPALMTAGAAFRAIGLIATPAGAAAAAIIGLAAAYGALDAAAQADLEGHFGSANLDLESLKRQVDSMTTEAEEDMKHLQGYVDQINSLTSEYKTALENFTGTTTTYAISGKKLTKEEKDALLEQGKEMRDIIIQGINTREQESKEFLNIITPDQFDSPEEYEKYSKMYDLLGGYFDDLRTEASNLGAQLNKAIASALDDDGIIDQWESKKIQQITSALSDIQDEIAQVDYDTELEKAGRVSFDDFEEYMTYLTESEQQDIEGLNDAFARESAFMKQAYEKSIGREISLDEWHNTDEYKTFAEPYIENGEKGISEKYGAFAQRAFESAMASADFGDAFAVVSDIIQNLPKEDGKYDYSKIDWGSLIADKKLPEGFDSAIDDMQQGGGVWGKIAGFFGVEGVNSEFAKMIEEWKDNPEMQPYYDLFANGALAGIQGSLHDYLSGNTQPGYFYDADNPNEAVRKDTGETVPMQEALNPQYEYDDNGLRALDENGAVIHVQADVDTQDAREQVESEEPLQLDAEVQDVEMPETEPVTVQAEIDADTSIDMDPVTVSADVDANVDPVYSALEAVQDSTYVVPIKPYMTDGLNAQDSLQSQGVNVQVDGDTTQLTAKINGADGANLMSYVDGDVTDLDAKIVGEDGKVLTEFVNGNTTQLANAINQYQNQVITVQVRAVGLLPPSAAVGGFAEGGRATSASIFGEAGPEWAIPEEHSRRTAELLNAARQASGFTWPELLSAYGGLNADASHRDTTVIYSPTVYANDATGVDRVLKDDKHRLDEWFEERKLRDRMEVYQ